MSNKNKSLINFIVRLGARVIPQNAARQLERIFAILQGKGFGGRTLTQEVRAAVRSVKEIQNPVIFDVGANHGDWSRLLLADKFLKKIDLHMFEPIQENWPCLNDLVSNGAILNRQALGAISSKGVMYLDRDGSPLASLYPRDLSHLNIKLNTKRQVEIITLDDYVELKNIQEIHFMKLDVEGHELEVLKGALKSLQLKKIKRLMFEFGGCNIASRINFFDMWVILSDHNYNIYRLLPYGGLKLISKYDESLEYYKTTNYFAFLRKL